jgi:hypothetical protein
MKLLALSALVCSLSATAADKVFTGIFEASVNRVCDGKLYIRVKTIEWNSFHFICKRTPYEILENTLNDKDGHIVYRLKKRNKQCPIGVLEIERNHEMGGWEATGFESLEDLQQYHKNIGPNTKEYDLRVSPLEVVGEKVPDEVYEEINQKYPLPDTLSCLMYPRKR